MPSICSSRRACTSDTVRARLRRSRALAESLFTASTAIGRSPGSLVSSVGRSARSGSRPRAASSRSRTVSTVPRMSVPQAKRAVVVTSPLRLTDRSSTNPGVAAMASSIGSATNRDTSGAAEPAYTVRIVSTGSATSGSSDTGNRVSDTEPSSTTASTAATVATGRRTANDAIDTRRSVARVTGVSQARVRLAPHHEATDHEATARLSTARSAPVRRA